MVAPILHLILLNRYIFLKVHMDDSPFIIFYLLEEESFGASSMTALLFLRVFN